MKINISLLRSHKASSVKKEKLVEIPEYWIGWQVRSRSYGLDFTIVTLGR
jgi:hypothetical protein